MSHSREKIREMKRDGLQMLSGTITAPHEREWIEKNIEKLMIRLMKKARNQKQLPLSISMSELAYQKFVKILQSKNAYFPNPTQPLEFLNIPVYINARLPAGTFTVESFSENIGLLNGKR